MLARSKLNIIERKMSEALINSEISQKTLQQLSMKKKATGNLKKT